ncbi:MAG TPA: hypothetical protein VFZ25_12070, partial [Chloroflexota bacterium]|nr:hypothetical protein [Chloroflexota bacterium]
MRELVVLSSIAGRSLGPSRRRVKVVLGRTALGALPLAALFLAVVLPAGGIARAGHFDGLYGQDPYAYLDYATGPLVDSLRHFTPPPPFYWPPGYPLLLALTSFAIGNGPLAGQIVSLLAGGLVPVFTALLAGEVWSEGFLKHPDASAARLEAPAVSLMAGLVAAFAGQLWQSSVVVMADTTGLALATLGVWALVRYRRRARLGWLCLAAVALAGAILTRWAYALVAIPCAVYAAVALARQIRRQALLHLGSVVVVAGLLLGPLLVPALGALLAGGTGAAPFATDLQVYSWSPLNAARRSFVTADGVLSYSLPNGLYYALAPARPYYFTPLVAWLILPGLGSVARRCTPSSLLIVGWAAIVFAFHAGAPWQNFRFTLAYLPPLAILVALGAVSVWRRTEQFRPPLARTALPLGLAVGLGWMAASGAALTRGFVDRKDADLATVAWLTQRLPVNAVVFTFGFTLTLRHYGGVETVDMSATDPAAVADRLRRGQPTYLFVDEENLETQWRGQTPEVVYRSLRDGPGLA